MSSSTFQAGTSVTSEERDVDEQSSASGDVIRGELENQEEVKRLSLNSFHLWGLGMAIVVGGQYIGWNEALESGFGSALIATVLISSGYICLVCCMAEVSSAIPFGGGSYGIARVTLGFFPGYIVACMEASQNVIFVASAAITFGKIFITITNAPPKYAPVLWLYFYVSSLVLQICAGRTFWYMIMAMAVASLVLLLIYVFGTIPEFDFDKYALFDREEETSRWFRDGGLEFMRILPFPCWFYLGIESINLACKDVPNPRVQVPRGYLSSLITVVVMTFAVLICSTSTEPNISQFMHEVDPLHMQFQRMFNCTDAAANILVLPSIYAMCSGFMYCYGKQLKSMAKSGLIHPWFAQNFGYRVPIKTLVSGSIVSFLVASLEYFIAPLKSSHLFVLCTLCAFVAYASQFASFIIFRYKFATIKREYESPLGITGAVYGCVVFTLAFIGAAGFQRDQIAITLFVVLVLAVVGYYFWAAQDRQSFSEEEKQVMFRAYLIKSNDNRNKRIKKGKVAQVGCAINATHSNVSNINTNNNNAKSPNKYHAVPSDSPSKFKSLPSAVSTNHSNSTSITASTTTGTPMSSTKEEERSDMFEVSDLGVARSPMGIATRRQSPRATQNSTTSHTRSHSRTNVIGSQNFVPRVLSRPGSATSQRVTLVVDTGSSRLLLRGEVEPEELYRDTALQGVLQDNEEVLLGGDEEEGEGGGLEIVTMTPSVLLFSANNSADNSGVNGREFADIQHLDV